MSVDQDDSWCDNCGNWVPNIEKCTRCGHPLVPDTFGIWEPIETAPKSTWVLMWWRPRSDPDYPHPPEVASRLSNNRFAEACVIGQISVHEPDKWWDGDRYQDIWHVTHWMSLPGSPVVKE